MLTPKVNNPPFYGATPEPPWSTVVAHLPGHPATPPLTWANVHRKCHNAGSGLVRAEPALWLSVSYAETEVDHITRNEADATLDEPDLLTIRTVRWWVPLDRPEAFSGARAVLPLPSVTPA